MPTGNALGSAPRTFAVMLTLVSLSGLTTCAPAVIGDLCSKQCDCRECTEEKEDECEIRQNGELDVASGYECDEQYLGVLECLETAGTCQGGGNFTDCIATTCLCDAAKTSYSACLGAAGAQRLINIF
jgi:hypothetical protein